MAFFLISSMVLGFLDQRQFFSHLYLIELPVFLTAQTVALDISKAFDKVWHTGLLQKLKSFGISGKIFDLFLLF